MARKPCHVSYRRELIEAISEFVPSQWFSQFSSHGNGNWSAQKVFWVSVVMSWQPRAALRERFQYACDVLREVFPRWKLGSSLSGFLQAPRRRSPIASGPPFGPAGLTAELSARQNARHFATDEKLIIRMSNRSSTGPTGPCRFLRTYKSVMSRSAASSL